jgi:hypothetical protein
MVDCSVFATVTFPTAIEHCAMHDKSLPTAIGCPVLTTVTFPASLKTSKMAAFRRFSANAVEKSV